MENENITNQEVPAPQVTPVNAVAEPTVPTPTPTVAEPVVSDENKQIFEESEEVAAPVVSTPEVESSEHSIKVEESQGSVEEELNKVEENISNQPENTEPVDDVDALLDSINIGAPDNSIRAEVELKEEDAEKIFVIEDVELKQPYLKDENGKFKQPEPFNDKKPEDGSGYVSKVHIKFTGVDYLSKLGKIRWYPKFVNDKMTEINPWMQREGLKEGCVGDPFVSPISQVYYLYCKKIGVEVGKVGLKDFLDALKGLKVKLKTTTGSYNGGWTRLDIKEIVE